METCPRFIKRCLQIIILTTKSQGKADEVIMYQKFNRFKCRQQAWAASLDILWNFRKHPDRLMASYYKDIFTEQRWNCQVKKTLNIKKTLCKFNEFKKKKLSTD